MKLSTLGILLLTILLTNTVSAGSNSGTVSLVKLLTFMDPNNPSQNVDTLVFEMNPAIPSSECTAGLVFVDELNSTLGQNYYPVVLTAKAGGLPVEVQYSSVSGTNPDWCLIDQFVIH